MGYNVHITRKKEHWADEQDPAAVSLAEWKAYVAGDPEMRLDSHVAGPAGDTGEVIGVESEGLSVWLPYSKNGRQGNYAWFSHEQDGVVVKNPDEEILDKMLAVAQVLGARVQGDDGEYFDDPAQPYTAVLKNDLLPWGDNGFQPFQTYGSAEAAQPLLAALARQGLAAQTVRDSGQMTFDPSFANNQLPTRFIVKLRPADFVRGTQLLDELNSQALEQASPDHYLFTFSDAELMDLLTKPDEWSSFDVALAGQLLRQRGREVSADTVQLLRQNRVREQARPEPSQQAWVVGGYVTALLGGLVAVFIGAHLHWHRKTLLNGQRPYAFSAADRAHGFRIFVLGWVVFALSVVVQLVND